MGNRQTETTGTGTTNYSYTANRLTGSTGEKSFTFAFDNAGNTIQENQRQYIYNQNQRLIRATEGQTVLGEYVYNGIGQRVKKATLSGTTIFHYDLQGKMLAESGADGSVNAEYVFLNGNPLAKIEGNSVYYFHTDHLGTPILITDQNQNVVWQGEFLPFGEPLSITGVVTNNLRFPGQYYDEETGLCQNWHRDYKPEIGRYISEDPIGFDGGDVNFFAYVGDDPVNYIDPDGLAFVTVGVNLIVDLSSIILPALICGAVLAYFFHAKARLLSLAAIVPFLVFSRRAWHFWEAPNLGLQISILFAPILGVVVLLAVVFIKTRNEKNAEQTARRDGE